MNERDIDIADMQCWVFRMAQTKWNISKKDEGGMRTKTWTHIGL